MIVEFGWAFFCRYEACVETFLKDNNVKLSKNKSLRDWLEEHKVTIPDNYAEGIELYRKIRNSLHHMDGASLNDQQDTEIHLYREHMENFFELFLWIGEQVSQHTET